MVATLIGGAVGQQPPPDRSARQRPPLAVWESHFLPEEVIEKWELCDEDDDENDDDDDDVFSIGGSSQQ